MGVEGEIIAGYMKKEQQLYWFWGVLLKNSLLGTHGSLATAVPNSTPATDLAKKLRVPCQPLPLKFCTVTTRLLLALKLHWFQKVCLQYRHFLGSPEIHSHYLPDPNRLNNISKM